MRSAIARLTGILVVAGVIVSVSPAAHAAFVPKWGGRIAFDRCLDKSPCRIFTSRPDGRDPRQLTFGADAYAAAWSPDGTQIAYTSYEAGNYDVWIMNADGSNPRQITRKASWDEYPTWSPDGRRIAFDSDRSGNWDIWAMNADGTNTVQLTKKSSLDAAPDWSPDGAQIAFESSRSGYVDVWTMQTNGTGPVQRTHSPAWDGLPDWAPDGSQIAFTSGRTGDYDIWTLRLDGGTTNVTHASGHQIEGAWAPNGNELVYVDEDSSNRSSLWVRAADPNLYGLYRITSPNGVDELPDWQTTTGTDWPQQGFDAGHSGFNPSETELSVSNVAQLVRTNVASGGPLATVADGSIFASDFGQLAAADPQTSIRLWTHSDPDDDLGAPAFEGGTLFASNLHAVDAFSMADGHQLWSSTVTPATPATPVTVDGATVLAGFEDLSGNFSLAAYDAAGVRNCQGSPVVCDPLWSAPGFGVGKVAAANGLVYTVELTGSWPDYTVVLGVFDEAGVNGCSGTPTVCQPLWTGSFSIGQVERPEWLTVSGGIALITSDYEHVWAFDASGVKHCSGAPARCKPLWSTDPAYDGERGEPPAVANGIVYVPSDDDLLAFDASGKKKCAGTPNVCKPLWFAHEQDADGLTGVTVANGVVLTGSYGGNIYAFDAAGCGVPACGHLWSDHINVYQIEQPIVVNGTVYAPQDAYSSVYVYRLPGSDTIGRSVGPSAGPAVGHSTAGAAVPLPDSGR